jgi:DNA invertase Pin-like site-specific DNA recombinase
MKKWWDQPDKSKQPAKKRAVAYYRHSMQESQENSIPIQREQLQEWAQDHDIEIINEFTDYGKSGLSTKHRDAFNDMIDNWVKKRDDFDYVLVLDVSRWGRFQDIDVSAAYSAECKKHGKHVIYTSIGMPREGDPYRGVYESLERVRAAEYSRELSGKVFNGCKKVAEQGYRPGGIPPYGLCRLLLNEVREPVQILKPGERKSIQNQRVTLTPGDEKEVKIIRRIFTEFAKGRRQEKEIADSLNLDEIPSPGGVLWDVEKVRHILTNELYIGTMVYNKTSQRLLSPSRRNPKEDWVRTAGAFEAVIPKELYWQVQEIFEERRLRYDPVHMLERLKHIFKMHGIVTSNLVSADAEAPSVHSYSTRFGSLDRAFQKTFKEALEQTKDVVTSQLRKITSQVEEFDDFIVLNKSFTVLVQPSVPVPYGYYAYWTFRPDQRPVVDITLGVPVSNSGKYDILGYLAMPRLVMPNRSVRIFSTSDAKIEMYGHNGLDMIKTLIG